MTHHCSKCGAWCAFDEFWFPRRVLTYRRDTGEPVSLGGAHCRVDDLAHDVLPPAASETRMEFYLALR